MNHLESLAAQPKRPTGLWLLAGTAVVFVLLWFALNFQVCTEVYPYIHSDHNYIGTTPTWRWGLIQMHRPIWQGCKPDSQPKHAEVQK